ncbi:MAG: hypothetical protein II988_04210 [Clostridia bacterium]|nr:hypothetical protein [Clostridia bacterium]MBQ3493605.1 hypothetical protein [Clostridia bacterium]MBQ3597002.1 hypothetical protein [Clostridia bacterium]
MKNELQQHKKSDKVKWIIVFISLIVLFIGVFAPLISSCISENQKQEEKPIAPTEQTGSMNTASNDFIGEVNNSPYVKLAMSRATTYSQTNNSASKTLTATVLPASAANQKVNWSVEWGDSTNTSNVSDYITVTPTSAGSNVATVTCYQKFSGNIIVTATTQENGYSASCIVTFTGQPSDIAISGTISPTSGEYRVGVGQAYTFDVTLSNVFNQVGSQFNQVVCTVEGVGTVKLGNMEYYNQTGTHKWWEQTLNDVALDTLKDSFITVSYANGKLTVNTIKTIESYYESSQRMDGGRTTGYTNKFYSFVDDCYFKVWVEETVSGYKEAFVFRFDESVVTGITVDNTEMEF